MPIQSCGQSVSARRGKLYTEIGLFNPTAAAGDDDGDVGGRPEPEPDDRDSRDRAAAVAAANEAASGSFIVIAPIFSSSPKTRGLHSSTFRLNVSTCCGIRWVHAFAPVLSDRKIWGAVTKTAQVELKNGRV
jgi:hypothetical protein